MSTNPYPFVSCGLVSMQDTGSVSKIKSIIGLFLAAQKQHPKWSLMVQLDNHEKDLYLEQYSVWCISSKLSNLRGLFHNSLS